MFALTFDRLLNIVIGLKYSIFWTVSSTKKLLIAFWIIGIACSIASVLVYRFKGYSWFWQKGTIYFTLFQSIAFIMVSFVVYSAIFWKYKQSRDLLRQFQISGSTIGNEHSSTLQMFRNSRFYVSFLIILTFLLFNTIPYCFFTLMIRDGELMIRGGGFKAFAAVFMLRMSFTSDAVIYIFLQKDVRRTLFRTFCWCKHRERGNLHQNGFHGQVMNLEPLTGV